MKKPFLFLLVLFALLPRVAVAQVAGSVPDNTPPKGNPLPMAGWDGTNTHRILTNNLGAIVIANPGSGGGGGGSGQVEIIDASGHILVLDSSGRITANINGTVGVTGAFWPYSLGQQVAGSSVPIVLTAAQLAALTPLSSISITNFPSSQAVTGAFWPYTLGQQLAGASVPIVLTAAQLSTLTPPSALTNYALEGGGNLASIAANTGNGSTSANQTNGNQKVQIYDGTNTIGTLLHPVRTDPTGTTTQPVNLGQVGGVSVSLGQQTAANSIPVILPSATITTLTPPTTITANAGTGTFTTNLSQVGGTSISLGQQTAANSIPVILPSATITTLTPPTTITANAGTGTFTTTSTPATSGGLTMSIVNSASGTNATNVKASAGQVYGYKFLNTGTACWIHMYNSASAPTAGSGTPVDLIPIAAGQNIAFSTNGIGEAYSAGIGYTITGAPGNSDTTAVAAAQVTGSFDYK